MSPTGTHEHRFIPSGDDRLVVGEFVLVDGKTKFRLTEPHEYIGPTFEVEAPAGYTFDGATVPQPLWCVFERYGPWVRAALFHDILYENKIGTRPAADALFLELMEIDGVPRWQRWAMYLAVRLWPGNWFHWRKKPSNKGGTLVEKERI